MVFDSVSDKKMVLQIIASFPMNGPYGQIARATKELDALTARVEKASIVRPDGSVETSPNKEKVKHLKGVKK